MTTSTYVATDVETCVCGEKVHGRLAGSLTRGAKIMRKFECHSCEHRWEREVPTVSVAKAPMNGNGHPKVVCPNCGHEHEAKG